MSSLLYAYGDVPQPLPQTVQCLDELVSSYLVDICNAAYQSAKNSQRNKLKIEDFKFALRNDPIKLGRAEELIATNKLITEAKKQFNETDNQSLKRYRADGEEEEELNDEDLDENENENENENETELKVPKAGMTDKKQNGKKRKKTTKKVKLPKEK